MSEISITKAAQVSGKSQATIRRWAAQKIIPARKAANGQWLFNREELINHLSAYGNELIEAGTIKKNIKSAHDQPLIAAYEKQIKLLESVLERERKTNDDLRSQLKDSISENFKLTHEIKAILSKETTASPTRWIKTKVQEAFGF